MAIITKDDFRAFMGSFTAGVTVVTTVDEQGVRWGLTATAFSSLSLDPPLCLVCIDNRTASLPAFTQKKAFSVNVLRASQEEMSNRFASRIPDKFEGGDWSPGALTGTPVLNSALASIECELVEMVPAGDHQIMIGKLLSTHVEEGEPLLYFRGGYADLALRKKA